MVRADGVSTEPATWQKHDGSDYNGVRAGSDGADDDHNEIGVRDSAPRLLRRTLEFDVDDCLSL